MSIHTHTYTRNTHTHTYTHTHSYTLTHTQIELCTIFMDGGYGISSLQVFFFAIRRKKNSTKEIWTEGKYDLSSLQIFFFDQHIQQNCQCVYTRLVCILEHAWQVRVHTAPHCTILHHTAPHYITLHHPATYCNTHEHTATYCNTLHWSWRFYKSKKKKEIKIKISPSTDIYKIRKSANKVVSIRATHCNAQQHAAPH